MIIIPRKALVALGFFCALSLTTQAAQTSTAINIHPSDYSILSKEQLKKKKDMRIYISQDVARTISSDPLFPYRANPAYSFLGYEYYYTPEIVFGAIATYTHENDVYSRNLPDIAQANTVSNVSGVLPYISYLATPRWLFTAQAGGYFEDYRNESKETSGFITHSREQVFTPNVEGYVTWIGPDQPYTATIRGGIFYNNQRFRRVIDSNGIIFPARKFESTALSASTRLKYFPDNTFWNAFLHIEADFRVHTTRRPDIFHPDNGRQNLLYQIGPGAHFKLNDDLELRILALHTVGFGYTKEERIGIRLRYVL